MGRAALMAVGFAALTTAALITSARAQTALPLVNGDFEAGATGWAPATGGTFVIDGSQPVSGGAAAGHAQSSAAGTVTVRSQYWLTAAAPGRTYALSLAVRVPAATIGSVTARLEVVDGAGASLAANAVTQTGTTAGYVVLNTTQMIAPPGTAHVLVVVAATASAAGARFSIDDVVVTETIPPPPPAPPPEAPPPPEDPGPAPTPAPTPLPPRASGTPVRLATATPTPVPTRPVLVNGSFDANLLGWSVARGRAWTDEWIPGQGASMVLHTPAAVTIWAEQVVSGVRPGGWYQASALLSASGPVNAGWLRIAWHDSDDGGGRSLGDVDSLVIDGDPASGAVAPGYRIVGTGPVQAPILARSATVRVLLRTDGGNAWLIADDVAFGPTEPGDTPAGPQPIAPSIAPSIGALPATAATIIPGAFAGLGASPAAAPAAAPTAGRGVTQAAPSATTRAAAVPPRASAVATPTATPGGLRAVDVLAPGVADHQRAIRITQILPDPEQPGADRDYEWLELTNLGSAPASLEGMSVRDNAGAVTLPALVIPAGGSLVLTARLAEVPGVTSLRLAQSIGNGLGNTGDRLLLQAADGRQVDAFSYGDDTTYAASARIPAPGTGRSIERRFGPDGTFRDAAITDHPTPGVARSPGSTPPPAPVSAEPRSAAAPVTDSGVTGAAGTWVILLAMGGGLLGGAAAQRIAALRGRQAP